MTIQSPPGNESNHPLGNNNKRPSTNFPLHFSGVVPEFSPPDFGPPQKKKPSKYSPGGSGGGLENCVHGQLLQEVGSKNGELCGRIWQTGRDRRSGFQGLYRSSRSKLIKQRSCGQQ